VISGSRHCVVINGMSSLCVLWNIPIRKMLCGCQANQYFLNERWSVDWSHCPRSQRTGCFAKTHWLATARFGQTIRLRRLGHCIRIIIDRCFSPFNKTRFISLASISAGTTKCRWEKVHCHVDESIRPCFHISSSTLHSVAQHSSDVDQTLGRF
jgi:hypothetical protein